MARVNREVVTALVIDASRARQGAAEFDRAAALMMSANSAAQRATQRTTVILGEQGKALDRLKRQIDPTYAALRKLDEGQIKLKTAFDGAKISGAEYVRLLGLLEDKYKGTSEAAAKLAAVQADLQKRAQAVRETIDPQAKAQRLYNETVREAYDLHIKGAISLKEYQQATERAVASLKHAQSATHDLASAERERARIAARRITQLSPQVSDIVTQAMSGTSPLTILVQQGPQIADIWGGIPTILRAIPPSVYAISAAFIVAGTAAYLAARRISEIAAQARTLDSIGRTVNPQIAGMAAHLRDLTMAMTEKGVSRADAIKAIEQTARIRVLQAEMIGSITNIAPDVMGALGTDAPGAAKALGEGFSRGANGVRDLNDKLRFLEPAQMKAIELMDRQGNRLGAMQMAMKALTKVYEGEAVKQMSAWERMTTAMGNAWDALWDKIARSPQAQAFMRDFANVADMITSALKGTEQAAAGTATGLGATSAKVKGLVAEANALVAQINEATNEAERLEKGVSGGSGAGVTVTIGGAEAAWERAAELNKKLMAKRREIADAEKEGAAPGAGVMTTLDSRGLTPDEQMRVQKSQDLYDLETAAIKRNRVERQIALAGHQAYEAARSRDASDAEARVEQGIAEARARRDIMVAIDDENQVLDLNIEQTNNVADAWEESAVKGLQAAAVHHAMRDELTTGAEATDRAIRLLAQSAAEGYLAGQQNLKRLEREVANLQNVANASRGGAAAELEARRRADADAQYQPEIDKAAAADDDKKVADLIRLRGAYVNAARARDEYLRTISAEADVRGMTDELETLAAEIRLIGATNLERRREIALLLLRQRLVEQGYDGEELEKELARQGRLTELIAEQSDALRRLQRDYDDLIDGIKDAAGIIGSGFEDAILDGERFSDVIHSIEKDLLRLGTKMLVTKPLENWLDDGGGSSILKMLGLLGGGPSLMPNAIGDKGAMSAADLMKDFMGQQGSWTDSVKNWFSGAGSTVSSGLSGVGSWLSSLVMHNGGVVGDASVPVRTVPSSVFVAAPRLHSGGLRPGEFGAVLERGEEVLTARSPRHRANFRGGGVNVTMNITTQDANSFRQSQGQMTAAAGRAISLAARRNG